MIALYWIAIAGLVLMGLAAIGARAIAEFAPHELEEICQRRNRLERLGHVLRVRDRVGLAVQSLRIVAAAVFVGAATAWFTLRWAAEGEVPWFALAANLMAGVVLLLALGVWIPWAVARLWAAPVLFVTWPLWWALSLLMLPLSWVARLVDVAMHRMAGREEQPPDEESFEDDIRTIVNEGQREGFLEEDAREMIEGVIELGDAFVSDVMTPRTDMISLPASLSWEEMLDVVIPAGHTRLPVFGRNRDDILGILHIKDLLPELARPPEERTPWSRLLRDPIFVPETKPIDALLQELQRHRNHMAVVLDEYGGVSGLVTLEDVLEEIVGEIVDEYDTALVDSIRETAPGVVESLGRIRVEELNERLGLHLPEDGDFDTIGGFVFSELGHIPVAGEQLTWKNVRVTVLEATRRRIERVRVEVLSSPVGQARGG